MDGEKGNKEPVWFKYNKLFDENLGQVDEIAQVTLKCHLIVEHALDNVIEAIFMNPKYAQALGLGFYRKLQIARSQALYKDQNTIWNFMELLNSLRNKAMHKLDAEERAKVLNVLRVEWLKEIKGSHLEKEYSVLDDARLILNVAGMSTGFLAVFEDDLLGAKEILTSVAKSNNPNKT